MRILHAMTQYSDPQFESWLDRCLNFEKLPQKNMFWLDTIRFLCGKFNNPQNAVPAVHIAGSKGKGSVSAMISAVLTQAGYRTGLYTSPHIMSFFERISMPEGALPQAVYRDSARELMAGIDSIQDTELPGGRPLTWFELVTLYAFLCFKNARLDWAVYETGLGGRLDATNVLMPSICAVTPIELEHVQYLGDTEEKIAAEKAGIIKPHTPVYIAAQKPQVKAVFRAKAQEVQAPVYFVDELVSSVSYSYTAQPAESPMHIKITSESFPRPLETDLRMPGSFQAYNAALAALIVRRLYPELDLRIIEKGLSHAFLEGRFEIQRNPAPYPQIPALVMDGAHTVNSVGFTMETFRALFKDQPAELLFACAADKDIAHIAPLTALRFSRITLTRPGSAKQADLPKAVQAFRQAGIEFEMIEDCTAAIEHALSQAAARGSVLLTAGSFYLVAEVKKFLQERSR